MEKKKQCDPGVIRKSVARIGKKNTPQSLVLSGTKR